MLCTALLALGIIAQHPAPPVAPTTFEAVERAAEDDREKAISDSAAADHQRKLDEKIFIARFNELVDALSQFSVRYKSEHVIDAKNVAAIRKAYRKLENSDPWFKIHE